MRREFHVRFCESPRVQSPRATRRNIYVRSKRAGERVMETMRKELTRLRLRINEAKSAVDRPWNRRFLGFTFRGRREARRRVSPRAIEKAKDRIRDLTNRNRGASVTTVVEELTQYLAGSGTPKATSLRYAVVPRIHCLTCKSRSRARIQASRSRLAAGT